MSTINSSHLAFLEAYVPPLVMTVLSLTYLNHPLAVVANTVAGVGINAFCAYRSYRENKFKKAAIKVCYLVFAGIATAAICMGGGTPLLITASAINMLLFGAQGVLALRKPNRDLEAAYYFINAANSGFLSSSPVLGLAAASINTIFCAVEALRAVRNKKKIGSLYYLFSTAIYGFILGNTFTSRLSNSTNSPLHGSHRLHA